MNRRKILQQAAALPLMPVFGEFTAAASAAGTPSGIPFKRCRPGDAAWPSPERWAQLNKKVGGQLIALKSSLEACRTGAGDAACSTVVKELKNPYYVGDHPGLTQTSGWVDAWNSAPSAYAVAAKKTADVVAAVNFARENNLRLVVKGGGHSYQGTSNAADALLVWTRKMDRITMHDAFVGKGCAGTQAPQPAITIESGATWMRIYHTVTKAGRYVQGGGCGTVGVAGLIQSGGFGSFSKRYGMAAAGLIEAEIVTADGSVRIANACTNPDLWWALRGGGGGSYGVVTRLTLRTRELPQFFGTAFGAIKARSDDAFKRLIARFVAFYNDSLFNPHWGESVAFGRDNTMNVSMVFQGIDQQQANDTWRPFLDWIKGAPQDYTIDQPVTLTAIPARHFFDPAYLRKNHADFVIADDRPGAPAGNVYWAGDHGQVGFFLHGYDSVWMPADLIAPPQQARLADALFASSRHWRASLHFNKGLAGAPAQAIAEAKGLPTNPAVQNAFALAIIASAGPPAYAGVPGAGPDVAVARKNGASVIAAMGELRKVAPDGGAYVSEANFFDKQWQSAYWGPNYPRLATVKKQYDPAGLFFVHNGVGSEEWSADGFTRIV